MAICCYLCTVNLNLPAIRDIWNQKRKSLEDSPYCLYIEQQKQHYNKAAFGFVECWTLLAVNKNTVICDKNFGTLLYVFHISEIISEIPSTFQNSKETHYKPQKIPFKNAHANLAFFERVIIISGNAPLHPLWCPFPFGLFVRKAGLASR